MTEANRHIDEMKITQVHDRKITQEWRNTMTETETVSDRFRMPNEDYRRE